MATPAPTALAHDFPILARDGLVYLDSAATAQKPRAVLDAMEDLLLHHNSNVHRGTYPLAVEATDRYEAARERVARFTGSSAARDDLRQERDRGDQPRGERLGPRERRARRRDRAHGHGAPLEHRPVAAPGRGDGRPPALSRRRRRGAALTRPARRAAARPAREAWSPSRHISNVLGTINPLEAIIDARPRGRRAHADRRRAGRPADPRRRRGARRRLLRLDRAQGLRPDRGRRPARPPRAARRDAAVPRRRVDDPHASSATIHLRRVPAKFEAGTPPIAEAARPGRRDRVPRRSRHGRACAHTSSISPPTRSRRWPACPASPSTGRPRLHRRGALISFALAGRAPARRVGDPRPRGDLRPRRHHCAQPLMRALGAPATSRASFAVHNTREDVDRLVEGLGRVNAIFATRTG